MIRISRIVMARCEGEITVTNSRPGEGPFFSYELLRFDEMPPVEVYMIDSKEKPGGVGEVGLPTVAPALYNALAAVGNRPYVADMKRRV